MSTGSDELVKRLEILREHSTGLSIEPVRPLDDALLDASHPLSDKSIEYTLQKRKIEDRVSKMRRAGYSEEHLRRIVDYFWQHPLKFSKKRLQRYRLTHQRGRRPGSLAEFRKVLADEYRFRVSCATLKRLFKCEKDPSTKTTREVERVLALAKRRGIDTEKILKRQSRGIRSDGGQATVRR
jgi:hypothetical protein